MTYFNFIENDLQKLTQPVELNILMTILKKQTTFIHHNIS